MSDMTFAEAIAKMDLSPDDEYGQRALVSITPEPGRKRVRHQTLTDVGGRRLQEWREARHLYTSVAKFAPDTITPDGGRRSENATSVDMLPFDFDLTDYTGLSHEKLEQMDHDVLDEFIKALLTDTLEVFARARILLHRVDCTGYGCAGYSYLHVDDQRRVATIGDVHKRLVARINAEAGSRLVDPAVSDPLSRIMRVVGSQNHKGPKPREVYTLWSGKGAPARLDEYPVDQAPIRRAPTRPISTRSLSETDLDEIVLQVAEEYAPSARNAIAFGLSAMLYKSGVPREQAHTIIERLAVDDEEIDNRSGTVDRTYDKGEAGFPVTGWHQLGNCLSHHTRNILDRKLNRLRQAGIIAAMKEEAAYPGGEAYETLYDPPPPECFYGKAGEYRNHIAISTIAPDAYHLASWLTLAGISIGRKACVWHSGMHYPILYTVLVGDTGGAKDTAVNYAVGFWHRQEQCLGSYVKPLGYGTLRNLSTYEGMLQNLNDSPQSRLLVRTSEFSKLLGKAARDTGEGIKSGLTLLWDGPDEEHLPTRSNPLRIVKPWVSLLANITPQVLSQRMSVDDIQSGFANRVLWVFGSGKGRLPDPPEPDYTEQMQLISETIYNINKACAAPETRFTLDPAAKKLFAEWDERLYEQRRYLNPDDRHLAQRLESQALRIALIFAATDGEPVITDYQLDAAMRFVEWQFETLRREARAWGGSEEAKLNAAIRELVKTGPKTRLQLIEALPRWGTFTLLRAINAMRDGDELLEGEDEQLVYNTSTRVRQEVTS